MCLQTLLNTIAPILRVVNWVWNIFDGAFEGIGGAFKNLMGQILSNLIALAKPFTKIIDAIFGTDLTSAIKGAQDKMQNWGVKQGAKFTEHIKMDAPELKRIDYTAAGKAGYDIGEKMDNGLKKLKDGLSELEYNPGIPGDYDEGIYDNTGTTAKNTADLKDEMAWLRDVAEQEVVNRFTAAELNVDMRGMQNTIGSDMDLMGIVNFMAEGVAGAVINMSEGVHE
jgi:hypothetical protein